MRILLAARRYPPDVWSGTETVFRNLYELACQGHETRLVVGYQQDRTMVPSVASAVDLRGVSKPKAWIRMARRVRSQVREWRPDVVLSNSVEVPPTGVPTVCIVHDLNFGGEEAGLGAMGRKAFYALRARQLNAIVTVSRASADNLRLAGVPESKIRVVHNGVDVDSFCPPSDPVPTDGRVHFVVPSRILPGKGQHLALDAFARLPDRYKSKSKLTIVGAVADGVYLDRIRVQAYGQPVEIATNVPAIEPYYQGADVILFPTVMTEGFGFTAVEGMACGKPVIWFEQPAVREATGGIGLAVEQGNAQAMRNAMMKLIDDADLRAKMGESGLKYVRQHLSWQRVWQRYEDVLKEFVDSHSGAR